MFALRPSEFVEILDRLINQMQRSDLAATENGVGVAV